MSSVTRYESRDGHNGYGMYASETGPYVPYTAIAALERECKELREELVSWNNLQEEFRELNRKTNEAITRAESAEALATKRGQHMARQATHLHETRQKMHKVEVEREKYRAKLYHVTEWMRADQHRQCVCCGTEPPKHDAIGGCYVGDGDEPCKAWTWPKELEV